MKTASDFRIKMLLMIFVAGVTLYLHIDQNNSLRAMQLAIPQLEKEVKRLQKENERLKYEIDRFESPLHLMELLRNPEFSHLKFPLEKDVLILPKKSAGQGR